MSISKIIQIVYTTPKILDKELLLREPFFKFQVKIKQLV